MTGDLESRLESYLKAFAVDVSDRHVGGPGNRVATRLFADVARGHGFDVEVVELPALDWRSGPCELQAGGRGFPLSGGPYSLPFDGTARLADASTVEQLEAGEYARSILLLHGDVAGEPLMPKNYPFYNPDAHRRIVSAVEAAAPAAVLGATGLHPDLAGGAYPFPLFEDGDFDIPNACLTDIDGEALLPFIGQDVRLRIDSERMPVTAEQLIARKPGTGEGSLLLMAHIDSKKGTPGALDNATGATALLGAAELLADYAGTLTLELWPFNGEDYYDATGQRYFIERMRGRFDSIRLGVNVDGAGYRGAATAVSLYGVAEPDASRIRRALDGHGFTEGPQWPQGDHSILAMNGAPVVAVTSDNVFFVASTIAHTPDDTVEHVDISTVVEVARFLADVVRTADESWRSAAR